MYMASLSTLRPATSGVPGLITSPDRAPAAARSASASAAGAELRSVNEVVSAALGSWGLPARVERLALPSLLYDEVDLEQMSVVVVEAPEGGVAVAAWEAAAGRDAVPGLRSMLLHGLYVTPHSQRRGLGTSLLELASNWMLARGFDAITAKVWRDSESFFHNRGFAPLSRFVQADSYPCRMWKTL